MSLRDRACFGHQRLPQTLGHAWLVGFLPYILCLSTFGTTFRFQVWKRFWGPSIAFRLRGGARGTNFERSWELLGPAWARARLGLGPGPGLGARARPGLGPVWARAQLWLGPRSGPGPDPAWAWAPPGPSLGPGPARARLGPGPPRTGLMPSLAPQPYP